MTEQDIIDAFTQVFPTQAQNSLTTVHICNILENMNRFGYSVPDLVKALLKYHTEDKNGRFCPTWATMNKYFAAKRTDDGARLWLIFRNAIARDGWECAVGDIFSDCRGTGTGLNDTLALRQMLITAGINTTTPAWGADSVFSQADKEAWFELQGNGDPAKYFELVGKPSLANYCKAIGSDAALKCFSFTRKMRFPDQPVPDAAKRFMAAMKTNSQRKEFYEKGVL